MFRSLFLCLIYLFVIQNAAAQVGISPTAQEPHPSAMLDVSSLTKGFLAPRMTALQMINIENPATGLVVYCTDETTVNQTALYPGFFYWNGNRWTPMAESGGPGGVPALWQQQIDTLMPTPDRRR